MSTVYIGVAQPGNVSLLLLVEIKAAPSDPAPSNRTVVTLLRDVSPTALVQHGAYFYYSVAAAQAIRRCDLNGLMCTTIQSTSASEHALLWGRLPPRSPSSPAGLSLDPAGALGLAWADSSANRIFQSAANGSAVQALWWPDYRPMDVELSAEGEAAELPAPLQPTLLAVTPLGGPVAGNSSLTVHGISLGRVSELRYIREGVWAANYSPGLGLAFLPRCHVGCPQSVGHVTYLDQAWRHVANQSADAEVVTEQCDNLAPAGPFAHDGVEETAAAGWFQFRGRAGRHMHNSPPGKGRCGAEAAGWLSDAHPVAGEAPKRSKVCFAFGWSDCLWSAEVDTCACSYDGGSSTHYSYRLQKPPGAPTCVSYCGIGGEDSSSNASGMTTSGETGAMNFASDEFGMLQSEEVAYGGLLQPGPEGVAEAKGTSAGYRRRLQEVDAEDWGETTQRARRLASDNLSYDGGKEEASKEERRRWSVVGYMPGDTRDTGAHLDLVSESRLFGRTPPVDGPRRVQVQVSDDDGASWDGGVTPEYGSQTYLALKYTFYAVPQLSRVWPAAGPAAGGTNITVSGTGFDALPGLDTVRCKFGSNVTAAFFKNSSHVLCATPHGGISQMRLGPKRFGLTINAQDYHYSASAADAAGSFTFYRAELENIHPTCGTTRGGVYVTLIGTGFDSVGGMALDATDTPYAPRCRFTPEGDETPGPPLPLFSINGTTAVCRTPARPTAGRSYVQLALNGINYEGEVPYDYMTDPQVVSVHPSGGPLSGGTVITLLGEGFKTVDQEDAYLEQWAADAFARSQYSNTASGANRATGPPDASGCGDDWQDPNSWMPSLGTDVPDWLEVEFTRPVRAWRWRIFMSARANAVVDVELIDMLGRRLPSGFNASEQASNFCPCGHAASSGCSAVVEGHLAWREQSLVSGLRVLTRLDGWESIDAVQMAGYAETQKCKMGTLFSSLLEQNATRAVCATPSHADIRVVVNATSTIGRTIGQTGFYYPLYLMPPEAPHHTHAFREYPGVSFYMPDAEAHHAQSTIKPEYVPSLVAYEPSATRARVLFPPAPPPSQWTVTVQGAVEQSADEFAPASNASDGCIWSNDGLCDHPPFCAAYSDCTDCGQCSTGVYTIPVELSLNGRDGIPLNLGGGQEGFHESISAGGSEDGSKGDVEVPAVAAFTFYPLPLIGTLWPDAILSGGGTLVTIHGDGFGGFGDLLTTKCRFGAALVPALSKEATSVVCEAPPVTLAIPDGEGDEPVRGLSSVAPSKNGTEASDAAVAATGSHGTTDVWLTLNDQDYQEVGEVCSATALNVSPFCSLLSPLLSSPQLILPLRKLVQLRHTSARRSPRLCCVLTS